MIAYKAKYDSYTHYRVDKMEMIRMTEDDRVLAEKPFDLSEYSKTMFQMFGGQERDVSVEFHQNLVGVVYDRFGLDVPVIKTDDEHFLCRVKVAVSPQFLSWIMSFGNKAKIVAPDDVVRDLNVLVEEIRSNYNK